jgi:hypothetical protein
VPGKPGVPGAVLMQQHPRQRPARPLAPVRATPFGHRKQALRLQECLGPAIAPTKAVIAYQVFVEMPRRKAAVAIPIQRFDLLRPLRWHPFARGAAKPAIHQTSFPRRFEPHAPAAKRPLADPKQIGRVRLTEFARLIAVPTDATMLSATAGRSRA